MVCFFHTTRIHSPKILHRAYSYHFYRDHCCWSFAVACKHLHSNGQEDQKHSQCGCSDHISDLAAESIRRTRLIRISSRMIKMIC